MIPFGNCTQYSFMVHTRDIQMHIGIHTDSIGGTLYSY